MPEGPETKRMADKISKSLVMKNILHFKFYHPSLKLLRNFKTISVTDATSKSKAIIIRLNNNYSIITHNQLYGKWTFNRPKTLIKTNRQLRIEITTEKIVVRLWSATDISVLETDKEIKHPYLLRLGPDVLNEKTSHGLIKLTLLSSRVNKRKLGGVLLDQSAISGLGNYLRSEILFQAKVNHDKRIVDLNESEISILSKAIKDVSLRAYRQKGSTLDYEWIKRSIGNSKNFKKVKHMVFNREGLPCFLCGTPIEKVIISSRRIFLCPLCQNY